MLAPQQNLQVRGGSCCGCEEEIGASLVSRALGCAWQEIEEEGGWGSVELRQYAARSVRGVGNLVDLLAEAMGTCVVGGAPSQVLLTGMQQQAGGPEAALLVSPLTGFWWWCWCWTTCFLDRAAVPGADRRAPHPGGRQGGGVCERTGAAGKGPGLRLRGAAAGAEWGPVSRAVLATHRRRCPWGVVGGVAGAVLLDPAGQLRAAHDRLPE